MNQRCKKHSHTNSTHIPRQHKKKAAKYIHEHTWCKKKGNDGQRRAILACTQTNTCIHTHTYIHTYTPHAGYSPIPKMVYRTTVPTVKSTTNSAIDTYMTAWRSTTGHRGMRQAATWHPNIKEKEQTVRKKIVNNINI